MCRLCYNLTVSPSPAHLADSVVVSFLVAGGGCEGSAEPSVIVEGLVVTITPYQSRRVQAVCDMVGRYFGHRLAFRFNETGTARFIFVGPSIERQVTVIP